GSNQTRTNSQNDSRFIQGGSVVQGTGSSTTDVMSQKAVSDQLLGVGQTWQNVTAQRELDVTYTNTTGRAISVSVVHTSPASADQIYRISIGLTVDGGIIQDTYSSNIPGSTTRSS